MASLREKVTGSKSGKLRKTANKTMKNNFGKLPSEQDLSPNVHVQTLGPTMPEPPMPRTGKGFQYLKFLARIPGLRSKEK